MLAVMHRLRAYHALLAVLAMAAYLSAEWGKIHAWFGYGVATVIVLRLVLAFSGAPQLGLMRFYPHFKGMKLGNAMTHPAISRTLLLAIAISLLGVTGTGIAMDRGRAIGLAGTPSGASSAIVGETRDGEYDESGREAGEDEEEGVVAEVHELLGNLLVLLVGLHVSYLLLFKRPLARFMLFAEPRK
jgi:cytochrome b